jgi:hypothetical protein
MTEQDDIADSKEIASAEKIISALLTAGKNFALYPEHHESYLKSVENLRTLFAEFFKVSDYLRFYVEKDHLIFKGQIIRHDGENLSSVLFRDGIRWIEIRKGIESDEITGFLKILKEYRVLSDNADGDLATALWEADFPHILYEAEEAFRNSDPIDAGLLTGMPEIKPDAESEYLPEPETSEPLPLSSELWELSSQETLELQRMVIKEENDAKTKDVLDLLLIILKEQHNEQEFSTILDFIKDEFKQSLIQGEFELAHLMLGRMQEFKRICQSENQSRVSLLQNFFISVSGAEVLESLYKARPALEIANSEMLKSFRKMFNFMLPEATVPLAHIVVLIKNPQLRRTVMEIIGALASKDIRPLEKLLESPEEELVHRLVFIMGKLNGKKIKELLLKMIGHPSESVRREALNSLMSGDDESVSLLFTLLDHDSDMIRSMVSEHLYRKKYPDIEEPMLDYLEHRRFRYKDRKHISVCYKILGRSGSSRALAFLEKVLFNKPWASLLGIEHAYEREAAAAALAEMGTEQAGSLLAKASKHPFPAVRRAYKKAIEASHD